MRNVKLLLGFLIFIPIYSVASPNEILIPAVAPLKQHLSTVDYFKDGRQSGCGLRITAETQDDIWLNVLITVFMKGAGADFGVIKIVARKVEMKDGKPLFRDGGISYLDIGNIRRAWIKPDSQELPIMYESGGPSHTDAYMATAEFSATMDLLVAISQEKFKVGLNRDATKVDEIYQFDNPIEQKEAGKLALCMNNLRTEIAESKRRKSL